MTNSRHETIIHRLEHWADVNPNKRSFTFVGSDGAEEEHVSYADLRSRAQTLAGQLESQGLRGKHVALMYSPGIEFVVAYLACLYAEAVAVPIHPARRERDYRRMRAILESGDVVAVLTGGDLLDSLTAQPKRPQLPPGTTIIATDVVTMDQGLRVTRRPDPDRLAMLQYTSGSTALPKGVMLTHRNILSDVRMLGKAVSTTEEDVFACWLPHYHDMGLLVHILESLYAGCHCVLFAAVTFINRPLTWFEVVSRYGVTASGAPNFAYRYCVDKLRAEDCQGLSLHTWKVAFSAAEPVRYEDMLAFVERFGHLGFAMSTFVPGYGLAEAGAFVTGVQRAREATVLELDPVKLQAGAAVAADERPKVLVSCGAPSDEQEVLIVEPTTLSTLPAYGVGEICASGENITAGYWKYPEESAAALVELPERPGMKFLKTGDLGFLDENGELYVTGRIKDLIIVRGVNYYPQDVEAVVERAHADIRPGSTGVFALEQDGEESVVLVADLERRALKAAKQDPDYLTNLVRVLNDAVHDELDLALDTVVLLKPGGVIKTSSGKISRQGCKRAYLADELDPIFVARPSAHASAASRPAGHQLDNLAYVRSLDAVGFNVLSTLLATLAAASGLRFDDIDISKSIFFYGIDSLKMVDIHSTMEAKVGCHLSATTFFRSNSLKGLVQDITREVKEGSTWVENASRFHEDVAEEDEAGRAAVTEAPTALAPPGPMEPLLLTGASGFVGVFLLHELLLRTEAEIYCLVRAGDEPLGLERILRNARSYDLCLEPYRARIRPVLGDISKPRLGLTDSAYARLAREVAEIYHCAAIDNFYLPYESLREPNVQGVRNVAELAAFERTKPLFYTSSCAAALFDEGIDHFPPGGLITGYSQSKYVAERYVKNLVARGYPVTYFRLGYLYSMGSNAVDNEEAFETLIESMYRLNTVPDMQAVFDLTPVEYAVRCIVDAARQSYTTARRDFTFYNPVPLKWSDVVAQLRELRPGIKVVPLSEFQEKFRTYAISSKEKRLKLLRSVVSRKLDAHLNAMFDDVVVDVPAEHASMCPPCDYEFAGTYIGLVLRPVRLPRPASTQSKLVGFDGPRVGGSE